MKMIFCLLAAVCFTVLTASNVLAQESAIKERFKKFKNGRRFEARYDKFDDETVIKVGPFILSAALLKPENNFQMTAGFTFPGQKISGRVDQFLLLFVANGDDWAFLDDRRLKMIVDGERYDLGEAERKSKVGENLFGDVRVKESLIVAVPSDVLKKMMDAKKVEMRLGRKEFKLKDEHLQALRDLYSLTASPLNE